MKIKIDTLHEKLPNFMTYPWNNPGLKRDSEIDWRRMITFSFYLKKTIFENCLLTNVKIQKFSYRMQEEWNEGNMQNINGCYDEFIFNLRKN
jgi:hypothetical protein